MKRLTLFFLGIVLLSFCAKAQTEEELRAIDYDYNAFKSELDMVVNATIHDSNEVPRIYAQFPRSLLKVNHVHHCVGVSDPFTPPVDAVRQAMRRASFLHALKSNCKAFGVIDYYSKYSPIVRRDKSMGLKEMVKVFVDSLYDMRQARIVNHEYLKSGELILTVDFSDCVKSPSSAIFEVFKSTKEKGKGIQETSNIKIIDKRNEEDYELKKDYLAQEITSEDLSKSKDFENMLFSYSSYNTKFTVKGGLWSYMILTLSADILDQTSDKTTSTKSVKDYKLGDIFVDLTRTAGFFKYRFQYKSFIYSLRKF